MPIELTDAEMVMFLDAYIRRRAKWELKEQYDNATISGLELADDALDKCAQRVHDDIANDLGFNDNLIKATRAVEKFGVSYVRKVIKAGMKGGMLESNQAFEAEKSKSFAPGSKLGSGARFQACVDKMMAKYGDKDKAEAICASIGRKAYGKQRFQGLAKAGKK